MARSMSLQHRLVKKSEMSFMFLVVSVAFSFFLWIWKLILERIMRRIWKFSVPLIFQKESVCFTYISIHLLLFYFHFKFVLSIFKSLSRYVIWFIFTHVEFLTYSSVPGWDVWPCLGISKSFSFHTISNNNTCELSLTGLLFCQCEEPPVLEDVT